MELVRSKGLLQNKKDEAKKKKRRAERGGVEAGPNLMAAINKNIPAGEGRNEYDENKKNTEREEEEGPQGKKEDSSSQAWRRRGEVWGFS